jgi:hypothetical protein
LLASSWALTVAAALTLSTVISADSAAGVSAGGVSGGTAAFALGFLVETLGINLSQNFFGAGLVGFWPPLGVHDRDFHHALDGPRREKFNLDFL